jgi:hypothetical protein
MTHPKFKNGSCICFYYISEKTLYFRACMAMVLNVDGECLSKMSSGERWQDYVDQAAACPLEWDFGTRFRTPDGREWECLDRGGAIRYGYTPEWMGYEDL